MSRDRDYSDRGQTKQNPDFWILAESGASLPCGLPRDSLTFAADSSHWCNALRCRPLSYQRAAMCQGGINFLPLKPLLLSFLGILPHLPGTRLHLLRPLSGLLRKLERLPLLRMAYTFLKTAYLCEDV